MIPALRARRGRIVNITSIGGVVATPFFGPYDASKYALEAISDCLRVELRPWGIETIAIEPGSIATEIWNSGLDQFDRTEERMPPEAQHALRQGDQVAAAGGGGDRRPRHSRRPRRRRDREGARSPSGRGPATGSAATPTSWGRSRRVLPDRVWDRLIGRVMRLP